jgi:transposase
MARNNRDFTAKQCLAVKKYIFLKGMSAKTIYIDMLVILGDTCPPLSTIRNWVSGFRTGHLGTEDKESSGRPTEVLIPENLDVIEECCLLGYDLVWLL